MGESGRGSPGEWISRSRLIDAIASDGVTTNADRSTLAIAARSGPSASLMA